ncbi:HNH endonuclease family protein [Streptomyces albipurpureus]|uniref:HNH endonuclease family protein n=1 Tax=Streptomyces albipurpureus TaxID=2897419 RepID=A0ABT0UZ86_9ACTN|nr:HNH endonuclease family protein [Streptomyces sp. CWNU-1]MCM2393766.1 HNH endonuclease family protein [Streptomyces sp. CWNU-1]
MKTKNLLRAAVATVLSVLPLMTMAAPTHAVEAAPSMVVELPLGVAVGELPVAVEDRTGYNRDSFKHWNTGLNATDGCNTRAEVLIAEAVSAPTVGARCSLTGGSWWSYYDDTTVTSAGALDIDHMVPLAEAWDSGASEWTAARREAYANDQGAAASLVAVTARSNRQKSDQDPADWLPPSADALCQYASEWTATKLRWNLAIDEDEQHRLYFIAAGCTDTTVTYEPAP